MTSKPGIHLADAHSAKWNHLFYHRTKGGILPVGFRGGRHNEDRGEDSTLVLRIYSIFTGKTECSTFFPTNCGPSLSRPPLSKSMPGRITRSHQHLRYLHRVFEVVRTNDKKCSLGKEQVTYLAYFHPADGFKLPSNKIKTFESFPQCGLPQGFVTS